MAESILFNVVANILIKLGSPAVKKLGLLWGVNDELHKLQHTLSSIQAVLVDAEDQQSKSHSVKNWVSKLKDVVYEIEDLMDECAYDALRTHVLAKDRRSMRKQVRMLFSKFKHPYSNLKLAHKIKDIRLKLKAINDDKTQFSFSQRVLDTSVSDEFKNKRETYSFILDDEIIGRDNDKDAIIKLLLDTNTKEDIAIISIVGMGGLGKTALTQYVYNDDMITNHFKLKLWVCISEEFDVKIIVEKLLESTTNQTFESFKSLNSLANELRKQIDEKKYLLVMDDVWNENYEKWVSLKRLLMGGAKGSRILITTRGEQVAKTFETTFLHYLQELDEGDSLSLFESMAFPGGQKEKLENSNLVKIGEEIVTKLGGVPLALRTIGQLLREKKSQKFWISFKDKELYQVMRQGKINHLDYMQSILELSYKHLNANLKQCFLYCALFPKDYEIKKEELILQWRAQGFIPPIDQDELIDIGEDYFLELLSKSFFQNVTLHLLGNTTTCKMHDLVHDLACSITKNECIHQLRNDIDKGTHHFSLSSMSCEESKKLRETLSNARNLRTFFMLDFLNCWELDCDKLFQDHLRLRTLDLMFLDLNHKAKFFKSIIGRFKHLRYLSISSLDFKDLPNCITRMYNLETLCLKNFTKLEKLPCDIKNLINLKHLDLCKNTSLELLPDSITKLCKLEALILQSCYKLKELPRDFKKLVNLKHLNISYCEALSHMPKGLGELTNLQTMNKFVLREKNGGELSELNGLTKLAGSLSITNLQFVTDADLQMKSKFLLLKAGLQSLGLKWKNSPNEPIIDKLDDVYQRVLDCLQPHSNIQVISIIGYRGVKLCNWLSFDCLGDLVVIILSSCERLQHLPQFDQFPHLKSLFLEDLPNIEYIDDNDYVSSSTFFPFLETLHIWGMSKLKRWWKGTTSMESTEVIVGSFSINFPRLSCLEICGCLHILMSWHAPSLESLQIGDSENEHGIEENEFDVVPWENFENLSSLRLIELSKLEYLPKCLQNIATLQWLILSKCENLKSLPEWIDNLTSLTKLEIRNCRKLTLLPEGIRHIHGLQSLQIRECPILEERCKKDTGEDWPKIAHIPKVYLSNRPQ